MTDGWQDQDMASSFSVVTYASASAERLFDVSLSIDEHVASMAASGEHAIAGKTAGTIQLGEQVTWRAEHFGVRLTMTSRITSLDRPHRFVDEQVAGPFRSFHHEHLFTRSEDATVMIDTLTVRAPVFGASHRPATLPPRTRNPTVNVPQVTGRKEKIPPRHRVSPAPRKGHW